jgi:SAM-dependent methyltransferase
MDQRRVIRSLAAWEANQVRGRAANGLRSARNAGSYLTALRAYAGMLSAAGDPTTIEPFPQLSDATTTTPYDPHYVHQGPWVFRQLLKHAPSKHVDVGSSVMYLGFFSAVAPTEFVDIRPVEMGMPGLTALSGSLLDLPFDSASQVSVSCLHVVEHVGLGRYGDPLDINGTMRACAELERILAPGGLLYLSLPIGRPRINFNAHRVHTPAQVREYFRSLELVGLDAVMDDGSYVADCDPRDLEGQEYACGMFAFTRRDP